MSQSFEPTHSSMPAALVDTLGRPQRATTRPQHAAAPANGHAHPWRPRAVTVATADTLAQQCSGLNSASYSNLSPFKKKRLIVDVMKLQFSKLVHCTLPWNVHCLENILKQLEAAANVCSYVEMSGKILLLAYIQQFNCSHLRAMCVLKLSH